MLDSVLFQKAAIRVILTLHIKGSMFQRRGSVILFFFPHSAYLYRSEAESQMRRQRVFI